MKKCISAIATETGLKPRFIFEVYEVGELNDKRYTWVNFVHFVHLGPSVKKPLKPSQLVK